MPLKANKRELAKLVNDRYCCAKAKSNDRIKPEQGSIMGSTVRGRMDVDKVNRMDAVAAVDRDGDVIHNVGGYLERRLWIWHHVADTINKPVTIIDRAELQQIENDLQRKSEALRAILRCKNKHTCMTCRDIATSAVRRSKKK